jgi:hypothetical protein
MSDWKHYRVELNSIPELGIELEWQVYMVHAISPEQALGWALKQQQKCYLFDKIVQSIYFKDIVTYLEPCTENCQNNPDLVRIANKQKRKVLFFNTRNTKTIEQQELFPLREHEIFEKYLKPNGKKKR